MGQRYKKQLGAIRLCIFGFAWFAAFSMVSCSQGKSPQTDATKTTANRSSAQTTQSAKSSEEISEIQPATPPARKAEITVSELKSALEHHEDIFLLDVRSQGEFKAGHIAEVNAIIPHTQVASQTEKLPADKSKYIYCVCRSGARSGYATKLLRQLGYTHVYNVIGGMNSWSSIGYPVTR